MKITDSLAIATALASLSQAISDTNTCATSSVLTSTSCTPLPNTYNPHMPFDVYFQAGSTAYANACASISKLWDGQVETFPSFIVNVRIHADKVKWNALAPHGILSVPTRGSTSSNIITEYQ